MSSQIQRKQIYAKLLIFPPHYANHNKNINQNSNNTDNNNDNDPTDKRKNLVTSTGTDSNTGSGYSRVDVMYVHQATVTIGRQSHLPRNSQFIDGEKIQFADITIQDKRISRIHLSIQLNPTINSGIEKTSGIGGGVGHGSTHSHLTDSPYSPSSSVFTLTCLSPYNCMVDSHLITRHSPPFPLQSRSLIQLGHTFFYFLLPQIDSITGIRPKTLLFQADEIKQTIIRVKNQLDNKENFNIKSPSSKLSSSSINSSLSTSIDSTIDSSSTTTKSDNILTFTRSERDLISDSILSFGYGRWEVILHELHREKIKKKQKEIEIFADTFIAALIVHTTNNIAKLLKIISPNSIEIINSSSPSSIFLNIKSWNWLIKNSNSWGRRIIQLNQLHLTVLKRGVKHCLDNIRLNNGRYPSLWWNDTHDIDLIHGIYKHGYGRFEVLKLDKDLSFFNMYEHLEKLQKEENDKVKKEEEKEKEKAKEKEQENEKKKEKEKKEEKDEDKELEQYLNKPKDENDQGLNAFQQQSVATESRNPSEILASDESQAVPSGQGKGVGLTEGIDDEIDEEMDDASIHSADSAPPSKPLNTSNTAPATVSNNSLSLTSTGLTTGSASAGPSLDPALSEPQRKKKRGPRGSKPQLVSTVATKFSWPINIALVGRFRQLIKLMRIRDSKENEKKKEIINNELIDENIPIDRRKLRKNKSNNNTQNPIYTELPFITPLIRYTFIKILLIRGRPSPTLLLPNNDFFSFAQLYYSNIFYSLNENQVNLLAKYILEKEIPLAMKEVVINELITTITDTSLIEILLKEANGLISIQSINLSLYEIIPPILAYTLQLHYSLFLKLSTILLPSISPLPSSLPLSIPPTLLKIQDKEKNNSLINTTTNNNKDNNSETTPGTISLLPDWWVAGEWDRCLVYVSWLYGLQFRYLDLDENVKAFLNARNVNNNSPSNSSANASTSAYVTGGESIVLADGQPVSLTMARVTDWLSKTASAPMILLRRWKESINFWCKERQEIDRRRRKRKEREKEKVGSGKESREGKERWKTGSGSSSTGSSGSHIAGSGSPGSVAPTSSKKMKDRPKDREKEKKRLKTEDPNRE